MKSVNTAQNVLFAFFFPAVAAGAVRADKCSDNPPLAGQWGGGEAYAAVLSLILETC